MIEGVIAIIFVALIFGMVTWAIATEVEPLPRIDGRPTIHNLPHGWYELISERWSCGTCIAEVKMIARRVRDDTLLNRELVEAVSFGDTYDIVYEKEGKVPKRFKWFGKRVVPINLE